MKQRDNKRREKASEQLRHEDMHHRLASSDPGSGAILYFFLGVAFVETSSTFNPVASGISNMTAF